MISTRTRGRMPVWRCAQAVTAVVAALLETVAPGVSDAVAASDDIAAPAAAIPLGSFAGVRYVQYDGVFAGHTSTGAYRITAPVDPDDGNSGAHPDQYRFYAVAGTPHVSDPLVPLFSNETPRRAGFHPGFLGSHDNVRTTTELGFSTHRAYAKAFAAAVDAYAWAGSILRDEASEMMMRASLCPPLTYTETYRDHYGRFAASTPC
jgi:hypothetical protein